MATRTRATVAEALTSDACIAGHPLKVSFRWEGHEVVANNWPECGRDYSEGEEITIYVASNDEFNVGPTPEWILDPSTHDPFDFIGPNEIPDFLTMLGLVAMGVACTLTVQEFRRNRRRKALSRVTANRGHGASKE